MKFHFFEEFPTEQTLSPLKWVDFPCTLFLAAPSIQSFLESAADVRAYAKHPIEFVYWPILSKSYWLSPFAYQDEIQKLESECLQHRSSIPGILLDLELPFLQTRLFWRNVHRFRRTKKLLRQMWTHLVEADIPIYTAEYPLPYQWMETVQEALGIASPMEDFPHTKILMFYSSLFPKAEWAKWWGQKTLHRTQHYGARRMVGVGTIATGIFGSEPILSPEQLHNDLELLRKHQVQDVVLFRLGGLTEAYMHVIRSFLDKESI